MMLLYFLRSSAGISAGCLSCKCSPGLGSSMPSTICWMVVWGWWGITVSTRRFRRACPRLQSHTASTFLQSVKVNCHSLPAVMDTLDSVCAFGESLHHFIGPRPRMLKLYILPFVQLDCGARQGHQPQMVNHQCACHTVLSAVVEYFLFFF